MPRIATRPATWTRAEALACPTGDRLRMAVGSRPADPSGLRSFETSTPADGAAK
jgi:hypothetical protein